MKQHRHENQLSYNDKLLYIPTYIFMINFCILQQAPVLDVQ